METSFCNPKQELKSLIASRNTILLNRPCICKARFYLDGWKNKGWISARRSKIRFTAATVFQWAKFSAKRTDVTISPLAELGTQSIFAPDCEHLSCGTINLEQATSAAKTTHCAIRLGAYQQ